MSDRIEDGTLDGAKRELLETTRKYREYCGPVMGNRKALRDWEAQKRHAEVRLLQAALTWLWHYERVKASATERSPPPPTGKEG